MPSHKLGLAPGRPGDSRTRDIRTSIGGSTIKVDGANLQPTRSIPQPKAPSRLPQSLHARRPSDGEPERLRLNHQPQSWDSTGSGGSAISGRNAPSTSNMSTFLGQSPKRRNVLRRKHSGLSQDMSPLRKDLQNDSNRTSSSLSSPTPPDGFAGFHFDREMTQSPMEVGVAQQIEVAKTTPHTVTIYPELDRYRDIQPTVRSASPEVPHRLATHDLPPPTPLFSGTSSQISGFSGSPSTRFSGSPGPGPYSRDTTPTSISSQSPGLVAPMRIPTVGGRMRPLDPALGRPPITRRRADSISNGVSSVSADTQGLASVRESLTSSSSNSTVRDGDKREKTKKKRLSPLPPNPPPRKSSQKSKKGRDEDESPSKSSRELAQPSMASPSKAKATSSSSHPALAARPVPSAPTPPARPSRDGTPDLQSDLGRAIPVIQSNLSSTSLPERRQSSLLASAPVGRPIFSPPSDQHTRLTRRSGDRSSISMHKRTISAESKSTSKPDTGRTARTPSPSVSTFRSRFPIFGRKSKAAPETTQPEKKEKLGRKGPAAGTGHEGYGRLGSVRRKSSSAGIGTRTIPGTMSSQESLGSSQPYDRFFAERMAPVIIAGGEVVENRNASSDLSRTESNQSLAPRRPSIESKAGSRISMSSREESRYTLWPSPFPRGSVQTASLSSRRPSDSSESEALAMRSTLALRRSIQRLESGEQEAVRIPKPIVTKAQAQPPSITSLDASIMSDDSILDASSEAARAGRKADNTAAGPKKLLRRARSPLKWNFFSRSQSQPAAENKKQESSSTVAATVKAVRPKPMAFYTMMDSSEQEDTDTPDLEEVLREARNLVTPPPEPLCSNSKAEVRRLSNNQELSRQGRTPQNPAGRRPSIGSSRAVTSPAKLSMSNAAMVSSSQPATAAPPPQQAPGRQGSGRPSRLPQVGRIPKVVSARAEQTSPKSFSRPFHRLSVQGPPSTAVIRDLESVAKGPTPPKPSTPELTHGESATTSGTNVSTTDTTAQGVMMEPNLAVAGASEFLSFSPRKGSCTTTTSSTSSGAMFSFADATAVVPAPNAPLAEDEIWDEYNDLLGEDAKLPPIAPVSAMKPVPLNVNKVSEKKVDLSSESPTLLFPPLQSMIQSMYSPKEHPASSIYSVDMAEQVQEALDIGMTHVPLSQPRLSGRSDRVGSSEIGKQIPKPRRSSSTSVRQTRYSSSSGASQCSEDSSALSQVNLRVGSMTVSKWLTFGHVLFSPVRDELIAEVGSLKRPSILVVDGLGNDDWSFYAAETYPAATFFNLSPRAPLPAEYRSSSTIPLSPPNHHQIQYLSHKDKFPFGGESFTAVVFRFPAAAPEGHYRNIISEARRVLKPGGFIELSILDVDLNNMGNRGRRTVRRLKERIHAKSSDTYLGSAADLMLRLLGRKGFTDIKTCRVGVPVASPVARSSGGEADGGSGKRISTGSGRVASTGKPAKDNRSLPEMISDESSVADESITKMVAKVGRWWYSSCYENAATPVPLSGSRGGLWNDKSLLSECEEWGTSLKLMVCHARAPDGRARVASI